MAVAAMMVRRPLLFGGVSFAPGDPFTGDAAPGKLRLLEDLGKLRPATDDEIEAHFAAAPAGAATPSPEEWRAATTHKEIDKIADRVYGAEVERPDGWATMKVHEKQDALDSTVLL